jgi:4-amino-4-deoxy-L-arabinose transferase-like glycosyltransferase
MNPPAGVIEANSLARETTRELRSPLLWMILTALAIRLTVAGFLYPERLNPERDHWRFAGETGRIAQSIVEGRGFSSPFFGPTGPTAIMPPIYPSLLALVFRQFGTYTKASALVMLSLDSLFSALTCAPVFLIAKRNFGRRTALWAGWSWTFFPYAIYFSADFIWVTTLATLMLALIFLAALHLEDSSRVSTWGGFGVLAGMGALTDPVVLSVTPLLALWMCWRRLQKKQNWFVPALAALLAFGGTVSPWMVRNYRVFHAFVPFRDNFGLELYVGNNGNTWHFAPGGFHPSSTDREMNEYRQLGELPYMRHKQAQAMAQINTHPGDFVTLSVRRAVYMWTNFWSFSRRYKEAEPLDPPNIFLCTGLTVLALAGLRRGFQTGASIGVPYAIALFFFPVVYYITHPQDYYRRPIDPVFVILAAYAVSGWLEQRAEKRDARAVVR